VLTGSVVSSCQTPRYRALHQPAIPQEPSLQGPSEVAGRCEGYAGHGQVHSRQPPGRDRDRILSVAQRKHLFPFECGSKVPLFTSRPRRTRSESRYSFVVRARAILMQVYITLRSATKRRRTSTMTGLRRGSKSYVPQQVCFLPRANLVIRAETHTELG
jgi:hypothetical protein